MAQYQGAKTALIGRESHDNVLVYVHPGHVVVAGAVIDQGEVVGNLARQVEHVVAAGARRLPSPDAGAEVECLSIFVVPWQFFFKSVYFRQ